MNVKYVGTDELFPVAISRLKSIDVLLDIGCGIMPQPYIQPKVHICCEPFPQYIEHLQQKINIDQSGKQYIILNATWKEAMKIIPDASVDSIFLIDVVEHLEKEEAQMLIKESLKKIKCQIAIFTPLGFLPQTHPDGKDAWGLDGGKWQEHKSGWQPEDFDESWDIYVAEVFHTTNNMGKPFETPYGALWAIKTIMNVKPEPTEIAIINVQEAAKSLNNKQKKVSKRQKVHKMVDRAIDLLNKMR